MAQAQAPSFNDATRQTYTQLPALTRPAGGGITRVDLPRAGLLARILLYVTGTVSAATGTLNPFGFSGILNNVRLALNNNQDVWNMSGPQFHYGARQQLDNTFDPLPQTNGRTAISAIAFDISLIINPMINLRDPIGLLVLQSEQALATLFVNWETDANVAATSLTFSTTPTAVPYLEWFTVPDNEASFPDFSILHRWMAETQQIAASGTFTYNWPRANVYIQMIHGIALTGASFAANYTSLKVRVNQSNYILDVDQNFLTMRQPLIRGIQNLTGMIPIDLLSTSGLGVYDVLRDEIDSSRITDLATVLVTTGGAGTLHAIRRELVPLPSPQAVTR